MPIISMSIFQFMNSGFKFRRNTKSTALTMLKKIKSVANATIHCQKSTSRLKTRAIDELKRRKFYSSLVARWTAIYLAAITPSFSTGHFQRALKSPRRAKLFQ